MHPAPPHARTPDPDLQNWKSITALALMIITPVAIVTLMHVYAINSLWLGAAFLVCMILVIIVEAFSSVPQTPPAPRDTMPLRPHAPNTSLLLLAFLTGWWLGRHRHRDNPDHE